MVDVTELREALTWNERSEIVEEAARAYADLLDEVKRIKSEEPASDWPMLLLAAVVPVEGEQ